MKILLCGFGNPDNRGCEAIIRTVSSMIKENFPASNLAALSNDYGIVEMPKLKEIDKYDKSYYPRNGTLSNFLFLGLYKVFGTSFFLCDIMNAASYSRNKNIDVLVSVGGDNFCYHSKFDHLTVHHRHYDKPNTILVHWGSSFEDNLMTDALKKDLSRFDLIFARESLSYDTLCKAGFEKTARLIPDPAFIMEKSNTHGIEVPNGAIGINISPMVQGKESKAGIVSANTINLINYITDVQKKKVLLIPHVADRKTGEGDYLAMKEILSKVNSPDMCTLIGYGYTAPEYKDIISKCEVFIGARTHSTIAAYSTCVPTLVLGYSVKALGIAKDLFGTNEKYVIPTQSLSTEEDLLNGYKWIYENRDNIKTHLSDIMPEYISKAHSAGQVVLDLARERKMADV